MRNYFTAMRRREIEVVGKKVSFANAEKEEITQWLNTSFDEKWKSLESMRRLFYNFHSLPISD
jgi:hypothetical protein